MTESVGYLLDHNLLLREKLERRVFGDIAPNAQPEIETQRAFKDGRADIYFESKSRKMIVEVRINTDFIENQPYNYLEHLNEGTPGRELALVLFAPRRRKDPLIKKTLQRLKGKVKDLHWEGEQGIAGKVKLRFWSFRECGDWIQEILERETEMKMRVHLEEIMSVIRERDREYSFHTKPAQLGQAPMGASLKDLVSYVNAVKDKLEEEGYTIERYNDRTRGFYFGFTIGSRRKLWFGYWLVPWAEGKGPIWLTTETGNQEDSEWFESKVVGTCVIHDDGYDMISKPIPLGGKTWDEMIERTLIRLRPILEKIDK